MKLSQYTKFVNGDEQTTAQAELDAYIEAQSQEIAPEIEIDSIPDRDFGESSAVLGFPQVEQLANPKGTLYRVWHGSYLLGTFYQAIDGLWMIQSNHNDAQIRCKTAAEAQLLIVATAGLLVANTTSEVDIDELLDKPFDELTASEWERLKELQVELMAA